MMSIHETYEREGAARRYALAEMTAQEQSAFEAHYFDCVTCGEEVIEWTRFVESGRGAAKVAPFRRRTSVLKTWLPSAAAAALVFVAGYQQTVVQGLRATVGRLDATVARLKVPYPAETLVKGTTRTAADESEQLPANRSLSFDVEIPNSAGYRSFRVEVRDGSRVRQSFELSPRDGRNDEFKVVIDQLPAGSYELVVNGVKQGGKPEKVAGTSFRVRG